MQLYDKRETFNDDILPLLAEIRRVCNQHTIQWTCCFQTAVTEDSEECFVQGYFINDEDFPASLRLSLLEKITQSPPPMLELFAERMGLLQ